MSDNWLSSFDTIKILLDKLKEEEIIKDYNIGEKKIFTDYVEITVNGQNKDAKFRWNVRWEYMEAKRPICAICGKECENEFGNNPDPLLTDIDARCCNECNDKVIAFRLYVASNPGKDIDKLREEFNKNFN